MSDENNDSVAVAPDTTTGETETGSDTTGNQSDDLRSLIEEQNKQIGILKRELKRSSKETSETPKKTASESDVQDRLDALALRTAEITHEDDVELAKQTANKWNMAIEQIVEDEDFKSKLDRQRDSRANAEATTNVKGNKTKGSPKQSADYWVAKGVPPTREQVPDRKLRAEIARAMINQETSGRRFYSD